MRCSGCGGSFAVLELASLTRVGEKPRYYCFKCYMEGGLR